MRVKLRGRKCSVLLEHSLLGWSRSKKNIISVGIRQEGVKEIIDGLMNWKTVLPRKYYNHKFHVLLYLLSMST